MKMAIHAFIQISLIFTLAACSTSRGATSPAQTDSLPQEAQLLLGTLKLKNTDLAVSAEQAVALLPLWETLEAVASSGTGAKAEVKALVEQIQAGMTTQQMAKITAMNLTSADLQAAAADYRTASAGSTAANAADTGLPQMASSGPMAGPAGGNPPADMGSASMGAGGSTSGVDIAQAASAASGSTQATANLVQVPVSLIHGLVEELQKIVDGTN